MTTNLRRITSAAVISLVALAFLSSSPSRTAADEHETGDACIGVKHGNNSSDILLAISTTLDSDAKLFVTLQNGVVTEDFGVPDDQGRVGLLFPIYSYGDYEITSVTATTPEGSDLTFPTDAFGSTTISIGPDEVPCDVDQLEPLAAAPLTPTATPVTTESPTASPTESATTTATESATPVPISDSSETASEDGASFPILPALFIIAGLFIALLGGLFFWGALPLTTPTRSRPRRSTPPRETPTVITPEAREVIQAIYAGVDAEGVRIAGLSQIIEAHDTLIGPKDSAGVNIGQTVEISVALDANGKPIPRIEDRDEFQPASSVMTIRVTPHQEHGGEFWRATVQIWDVDTARLEFGQSSGATSAEHAALTEGRPTHEYGNDPEYHAAMLDLEATTVADAVAQALGGAASGGTVVPPPR
ncbi:MAG: hypothetical protein HOH95_09460 [Dehalococcoidia bacterium]|jgi:hypothetical protein|nr:hypothetical protein [Dehalococcoidia bacterium]